MSSDEQFELLVEKAGGYVVWVVGYVVVTWKDYSICPSPILDWGHEDWTRALHLYNYISTLYEYNIWLLFGYLLPSQVISPLSAFRLIALLSLCQTMWMCWREIRAMFVWSLARADLSHAQDTRHSPFKPSSYLQTDFFVTRKSPLCQLCFLKVEAMIISFLIKHQF